MRLVLLYSISTVFVIACSSPDNVDTKMYVPQVVVQEQREEGSRLACTDTYCEGSYYGAEFIDGADIAHQFSNNMSSAVGDRLKLLYEKRKYSKVDFSSIVMFTKGMGSGTVTYTLKIPFEPVADKCDAYTSFDHVGGWNHKPALSARKRQLKKVLLKGEKLDISELKTTPEGLQEYWIQWKNKDVQAECRR